MKLILSLVIITGLSVHCMQRQQKYNEHEVLIKFREGTDSIEIDSICRMIRLEKIRDFKKIGVSLYKINSDMSVEEVIVKYKEEPVIEYMEPNYTIHLNK